MSNQSQSEVLKKAAQPVRAMTNANGMIQIYTKMVEQVLRDKAAAAANEKRSA